jgi:hypothetical protein
MSVGMFFRVNGARFSLLHIDAPSNKFNNFLKTVILVEMLLPSVTCLALIV